MTTPAARHDRARNRLRTAVDGDRSTAQPSRAVPPRAAADPRARAPRPAGRRPAARASITEGTARRSGHPDRLGKTRSESDRVEKALAGDVELARRYALFSRSLRRRSTSTRHSASRRRGSQRRYSPRSILRRHVRPVGGSFIDLRESQHSAPAPANELCVDLLHSDLTSRQTCCEQSRISN